MKQLYSQRAMTPTTYLPDKQVFTVQTLINSYTVETECINVLLIVSPRA